MKVALMVIALLLLGSGAAVLVSEGRALSQLENKTAGFANANGFVAERDDQTLLNAVLDDGAQLEKIIKMRLADAPFDPVLLGLKAEIRATDNLGLSAKLLDQAQAIAPHDPRVRALRAGLQMRLQAVQSPPLPLAK